MKSFTTLAAVAALLAGISMASAQNAGTPNNTTTVSPNSINKGADKQGTGTSGSESAATAKSGASNKMGARNVTGTGKFCEDGGTSSPTVCSYATLEDCVKAAKPNSRTCMPNPNMGTTGSKAN